jgi:hypothetical protein
MVNLLFILHIITAVVLLLVTATYLVEFSYRHQNYTKLNEQNSGYSDQQDQKYKNLRIGKTADGASYAGCYKWGLKKCKSLSEIKQLKDSCQQNYDLNKNDAFDPILEINNINLYQLGEESYKYVYCTNEWYKWSASRFIPAILTLFLPLLRFYLH